jgi:hypothetical protein
MRDLVLLVRAATMPSTELRYGERAAFQRLEERGLMRRICRRPGPQRVAITYGGDLAIADMLNTLAAVETEDSLTDECPF